MSSCVHSTLLVQRGCNSIIEVVIRGELRKSSRPLIDNNLTPLSFVRDAIQVLRPNFEILVDFERVFYRGYWKNVRSLFRLVHTEMESLMSE